MSASDARVLYEYNTQHEVDYVEKKDALQFTQLTRLSLANTFPDDSAMIFQHLHSSNIDDSTLMAISTVLQEDALDQSCEGDHDLAETLQKQYDKEALDRMWAESAVDSGNATPRPFTTGPLPSSSPRSYPQSMRSRSPCGEGYCGSASSLSARGDADNAADYDGASGWDEFEPFEQQRTSPDQSVANKGKGKEKQEVEGTSLDPKFVSLDDLFTGVMQSEAGPSTSMIDVSTPSLSFTTTKVQSSFQDRKVDTFAPSGDIAISNAEHNQMTEVEEDSFVEIDFGELDSAEDPSPIVEDVPENISESEWTECTVEVQSSGTDSSYVVVSNEGSDVPSSQATLGTENNEGLQTPPPSTTSFLPYETCQKCLRDFIFTKDLSRVDPNLTLMLPEAGNATTLGTHLYCPKRHAFCAPCLLEHVVFKMETTLEIPCIICPSHEWTFDINEAGRVLSMP